eukprot:102378_1
MGTCVACASEHNHRNIDTTNNHTTYETQLLKQPLSGDTREAPSIHPHIQASDPAFFATQSINTNVIQQRLLNFPTPPRLRSIDERCDSNQFELIHVLQRRISDPLSMTREDLLISTAHSDELLMINHPSDQSIISNTQTSLEGYTPITYTYAMPLHILTNSDHPSDRLHDPIASINSTPLPILSHWTSFGAKKDTGTPSENTTEAKTEEKGTNHTHALFLAKINLNYVLLYGYIRCIVTQYKRKHGIENDEHVVCRDDAIQIFSLLGNYFIHMHKNMLFCLDESTENILYVADLNDVKAQTHFKCSIRNVFHMDTAMEYTQDIYDAGLTHSDNVALPSCINDLLHQHDGDYDPIQNSVIFHCGAKFGFDMQKDFECSALIVNEKHLYDMENEDKQAFYWKLPSDGISMVESNGIVFSDCYKCLFCVGGTDRLGNITTNVWRLSFDEDAFWTQNLDKWKWFKMPDMMTPRALPSCVMINTKNVNHRSEYMCVLGGYNNDHGVSVHRDKLLDSVEIFDLNHFGWMKSNKLRNMKIARCGAGVCFEEYMQRIFIGGGTTDNVGGKHVEFCDIHQNEWYALAPTNLDHKHYPSLWIENSYILHIASVTSDGMEYIDLRDNANKWHVVGSQSKSYQLSQLFDLSPCPFTFMESSEINQLKYRLIR